MTSIERMGETPASRRSVVKGAAWAVPAVMVAAAAPTVAASEPPVFPNFATAIGCKLPGENIPDSYGCWAKGYVLFVNFENTFNYPVYIKVTDIAVTGVPDIQLVGAATTAACNTLTNCILVGPKTGSTNGSTQVAVYGNGSTDSASNPTVTVDYEWYTTDTCGGAAITASVGNTVGGNNPWTVNPNGSRGGSCRGPASCVTPPTIAPCA